METLHSTLILIPIKLSTKHHRNLLLGSFFELGLKKSFQENAPLVQNLGGGLLMNAEAKKKRNEGKKIIPRTK